jgi:hypothetical protein
MRTIFISKNLLSFFHECCPDSIGARQHELILSYVQVIYFLVHFKPVLGLLLLFPSQILLHLLDPARLFLVDPDLSARPR